MTLVDHNDTKHIVIYQMIERLIQHFMYVFIYFSLTLATVRLWRGLQN
jgi:hypothetical protein